MSIKRIALWMAAVVLLSGWGNVGRNYRFDPGGSEGLVAGSISYEGGLGRYFLVVESEATSRKHELGFGCAVWPCMQPADDEDFSRGEMPEQRGGGFVVSLPEGTYRLTGWRVRQGSLSSRSKEPVDIEFVVARGKVSYLGNLHFDGDWEDVRLRDRSDRDLPLLQEKFPVLQDAGLAYSIAPGTDLVGIGGMYKRGLENLIIFIPVAR